MKLGCTSRLVFVRQKLCRDYEKLKLGFFSRRWGCDSVTRVPELGTGTGKELGMVREHFPGDNKSRFRVKIFQSM